MSDRCFLGVDLGASSGRVIAGLLDGRRVRLEEVHRFSNGPVAIGGTLRWDVLRLWSEMEAGLSAASARYGDSIASVGVDTWGVDYVLLSQSGEIIGQPYNYRDSRTTGQLERALSRVSRDEIFQATGLQFMEINTLYQLLAMQQMTPELLKVVDRLLLMPDFFHWCLCGSRVVEFTNATTTQCFDPVKQDWAFDLIGQFNLPAHIFPEVVGPGTKLANLREDVAERTGLKRIDVVAPATHDTGAAVAAIPTERTGSANWAYISSGTWSLMGVESAVPILSKRALQLNVTNEGGIDGTYRVLKNIMGLWLIQECRRSFDKRGLNLDFGRMVKLASEAEPFRSLIDPDDQQFLNPDDMPRAIQTWCQDSGQPVPETEGQLVRCALESLALKYQMVLGWLEELTGVPVEVVHLVGGGTQNRLLNQFTANACGRPVLTGPIEATALGNVLIQARTAGELGSLADIREVVRASSEIEQYDPQDRDAWKAADSRFRSLLDQMAGR